MWVPPSPSAFIASCGKLRELDDIDTALMDVDGTETADAQRTPILPSSPYLLFVGQQKQIGRIFPMQAPSSSKKSSIRTS